MPAPALGGAAGDAFHLWLTIGPRLGIRWMYVASVSAWSLRYALLLASALTVLYALARGGD